MAARISIVIPTLDDAHFLPDCLSALMEGLHAGLIRELVIADGGSTDATLRIADAAGATVLPCRPGRAGQVRRGIAAARGDWVLILDADAALEPGWSDAVMRHMRSGGGPACFRLGFRGRGLRATLRSAWANLRARMTGTPGSGHAVLSPTETIRSGEARSAPGVSGRFTILPVRALRAVSPAARS